MMELISRNSAELGLGVKGTKFVVIAITFNAAGSKIGIARGRVFNKQ